MTRAKTVNRLTLDRWAEILGISPVHFSGATSNATWMYDHACNDVWAQYSWQRPETASREHVADLIHTATTDIENILGYHVAPTYIHGERIAPPIVNLSRRWAITFETYRDKLINFGQYTKTLVMENVEVVLVDDDSDDFDELATLTFDVDVNPAELRFYTQGKGGNESYRLYPKTIELNEDETYTATFDSWLFIAPNLWEYPPAIFIENSPIDAGNITNYNIQVDIYRYYLDTTKPQAKLIWASGDPYVGRTCVCGGTGCTVCGVTTQDACVTILDAERGYVLVAPATYNSESSMYLQVDPTVRAVPTSVELYYTSGDVDQGYLMGTTLDPLKLYWAEAITWMSAARLRFPVCSCSGIREAVDDLMRNLVEVDKNRSIYVSILAPDMLTNPFGTRQGEAKAWDRVYRINQDGRMGGGIV